MLCSDFSMRLMISRSTDSGEAPGYGTVTTITGCSTSGIWLTRSLFSASRPRHISAMMMTTVEIGRLMLKSESSMFTPRRSRGSGNPVTLGETSLGPRFRGNDNVSGDDFVPFRHCRFGCPRLHRLVILEQRGRIAEDLIARRESALQHIVAGPRIAFG